MWPAEVGRRFRLHGRRRDDAQVRLAGPVGSSCPRAPWEATTMGSGVSQHERSGELMLRRTFIRRIGLLTGGALAGGLLSSCSTAPPSPAAAPPAPTVAPAVSKPGEAAKPAAAASPAAPAAVTGQ